jgi:hypothetical protein
MRTTSPLVVPAKAGPIIPGLDAVSCARKARPQTLPFLMNDTAYGFPPALGLLAERSKGNA